MSNTYIEHIHIETIHNKIAWNFHFKRTTRHVELTDVGKSLLAEVRLAFQHLDEGSALVERAKRGEVGRLVVGYMGTTLYGMLPTMIREFRERFPAVEVVLQEVTWSELLLRIDEGLIDVGCMFVPLMIDVPTLEIETIAYDTMTIALPLDHPLAEHEALPLSALFNEPFVMCSRKDKSQESHYLISLCHAAGFSPHVVQKVASESALLGLVAAGIGVGITIASLRKAHPEGIAYRTIDPTVNIKVVLAWKSGSTSPQVQSLRSIAQEISNEQITR